MSPGVEALARCLEQWRRLRGDADLGVATEEILRWATPLHHFRRTRNPRTSRIAAPYPVELH